MLLVGRSLWSILLSLSVLVVPSYFKFVVESNSLTGASVLAICLLSVRRRLAAWKSIPLSIKHGPKSDVPYDVKVLSYNIFLRPPLVKNNADDFKNERLKEFINHIDQYDIISLQEMFCLANSRQRVLLNAAREKGFKYHCESINAAWYTAKFIDAGLLIMSKYPILESDGYIYRSGNQIDGWAAKQVIYAKIQITGTFFLHVFNTHLQASYFDSHENHNKINDFARADQVSEMAAFIEKKTSGSPYPILVTGDFNINSREVGSPNNETREYKYMMETLDPTGTRLRDLLKEEYNGIHPITYGDVHEQVSGDKITYIPRETLLTHTADHCCGLSIDYVFFGDTESNKSANVLEVVSAKVEEFLVDPAVVKCSQLSDHYGITTTLRVNKSDVCVEEEKREEEPLPQWGDSALSVSLSDDDGDYEL